MGYVIVGWSCLGLGVVLGFMLKTYLDKKSSAIVEKIDETAQDLKDGLQ